MTPTPDIFGLALTDYYTKQAKEDITVISSIAEDDSLPLSYLFRDFHQMPLIEQKALELCSGKTLDVGVGAGSHSLWLYKQGIPVTGLDISQGAVAISRKRLARLNQSSPIHIYHQNVFEHQGQYDTLLMLMNGTGIFERIDKLNQGLQHLKSLLQPKGQILIDSSDIRYMYEDEDGGFWVDTHKAYYGEVTYSMRYKDQQGPAFDWLYLDFDTLTSFAHQNGLKCQKLLEGAHFDYLARLTLA